MQEHHLFEYAVIRVVPRVEREEFVNVGVIVFCPSLKFLKAEYYLDPLRLTTFSKQIDIDEIDGYLNALVRICEGRSDAGPIGCLPAASRFRWLTATRSSVVQASKVHPGYARNPEITLSRLMRDLVL
jgi:hypothetical protein